MSDCIEILEVTVTFPDIDHARQVVNTLMKEKLIACANLTECESHYIWNETINQSPEIIAYLKTSPDNKSILTERINALHPYEVPCILIQTIKAEQNYGSWVINSVR